MSFNDADWLASLKPGDPVACISRGDGYLSAVHKVTATQIVIRHANAVGGHYDVRYRKRDGWACGSDAWDDSHLSDPSGDEAQRVFLLKRCAALRCQINNALVKCADDEIRLRRALDELTPAPVAKEP